MGLHTPGEFQMGYGGFSTTTKYYLLQTLLTTPLLVLQLITSFFVKSYKIRTYFSVLQYENGSFPILSMIFFSFNSQDVYCNG